MRDLRFALQLTQKEVGDRGQITPYVVADIEGGGNKATSFPTRQGIAKGLGLSVEELEDLFARRVTVEEMAARVFAREPDLARAIADRAAAAS